MQRITVNLVVDSIEACLPFWEGRLGFDRAVEAPEGDVLGFVVLEKDGLEINMQTPQSLANDIVELSGDRYRSFIYIHVDDLEPIRGALVDHAKVIPERETFDGVKELVVRDPAGNVVIFAQQVD